MLDARSALGHKLQMILQQAGGRASFGDIMVALRRSGGAHSVPLVRQVLGDSRVFLQLAGDVYGLRDLVGTREHAAPREERPRHPSSSEQPWIGNVARARSDYVVIDLETTGTRPGRDGIIQVCLLRVAGGQPVKARNYYINPGGRAIPYSLRVLLHLDRRPDVLQAILQGPSLGEVLPEIRAEIGELPLVAHNARFDLGFLKSFMPDLANAGVDTLELAILLLPGLRRYRLDDVRLALGISYDAVQADLARLLPELGLEVDAGSLHNAATDVFILHKAYCALLARLSATGDTPWIEGLIPELRAVSGGPPDLQEMIPEWHEWEQATAPDTSFSAGAARRLLDRFRIAHGFEERCGQAAMVDAVAEAWSDGRHKLIEAPTGTGKTLAYLVPSVLFARDSAQPILLCTAYRNLQDQLLRDADDLRASTEFPFRYQVLKGFGNYFCLRAIHRLVEELENDAPLAERYLLSCIVGLIRFRPEATIDDLHFWLRSNFDATGAISEAAIADLGACSKQRCAFFKRCGAMAARQHAGYADLIVANHALWLSQAAALPPAALVVFDEAHALEDQATAALTDEVSYITLRHVLRRVYDPTAERGLLVRFRGRGFKVDELAFGLIRRALTLARDFGEQLREFVERKQTHFDVRYGAQLRLEAAPARVDANAWQRTGRAHQQIITCLTELARRLDQVPRPPATSEEDLGLELDAALAALNEQIDLLVNNVVVANERKVYWIELVPEEEDREGENGGRPMRIANWALKAAPISVADDLEKRFADLSGVVLTSATLALEGGDFSFVLDRLGLKPIVGPNDMHVIPSDLDYAGNVFLGLPNYFTYSPLPRTMRSFQEELAEELKLLLRYTEGRALGLFTARDRMEYVYARCEESLGEAGIPLYCQAQGASRTSLLEEFTSRPEAVLFGLRSYWEGIDVPGETLSFVLIEKLPFPFYFDPIFKARREAIAMRRGNEFDDYVFPLMAIQFKQGFGRLIRRKEDRGAVILYDKRLHKKVYKERLLRSLPGFLPRDLATERDRSSFYRSIAERLPGLIDIEAKRELLDSIPSTLLTDLETLLQRFQLADTVSAEQYESLRPQIIEALAEVFDLRNGFLSPEQEDGVRHMLAGEDALVLLPTGGGKSLCFQLPALLQPGVTLVFSPLIALMRDQVQGLIDRGIEVVGAIYAGQSVAEREDLLQRMRAGRTRLVYISPERLRDRQLLRAMASVPVRRIVVDEAHCVSLWGPQFRPDFLHIDRLFAHLGYRPPVAAFTATATPPIRKEIVRELGLAFPAVVEASFDRPELRFLVYNQQSRYSAIHSRNDRFAVLLRVLRAAGRSRDSVLIYVATTVEAELLARRLRLVGYDARAYHGKMDAAERESVQQLFMDDDVNIVVCTKAFGMGIDKPDIRYVVHYNMPGDLESYFQEAGRAGRDRQPAWCVLLYHEGDRSTHEYFIDNALPGEDELNDVLQWLRARVDEPCLVNPSEMLQYFGVEETRLRVLLHLLEKDGFLERHEDVTCFASTTLFYTPAEIADYWEERSPEMAKAWRQLGATGVPSHQRFNLDVLDLARATGLAASRIDELLTEAALADLVTYRPWQKAWSIARKPKLRAGERYVGDEGERARRARELEDKLDQMEGYARSMAGGQCRRAQILNYFGQSAPERCGTCDVCNPELEVPWADVAQGDFAPLQDYLDVGLTLLEAVHWNGGQSAPIGQRALVQVLLGNSYQLIRYVAGERDRERRLRRLRDCSYWSVFSSLPRGEPTLSAGLERLQREGYIATELRQFQSGSELVSYEVAVLTAAGGERLATGEHFSWR